MKKNKSWGVVWQSDIQHGLDRECQCGEVLPYNTQARIPLLVGFTTSCPPKEGKVGAGIFECSACFLHFWFHLTAINVACYKKHAPQWPK